MQMYNVKKYFWCKMSCLNIPSFKNFEIHIFQSSSHARPISFGRIVCKLCRAGETCAKTLTGFEFLWAYSSARWQALPCRNVVGWPHSCTVYLFTIFEKSQWTNTKNERNLPLGKSRMGKVFLNCSYKEHLMHYWRCQFLELGYNRFVRFDLIRVMWNCIL